MKINAIVLAAGYGSRLSPLTLEVPKPALPIAGVPMLVRILRKLKAAGADRIAVNTHHLKEKIEDCVAASGLADSVELFHETEILGTAGPLVNAKKLLTDCDYFLLHNSDIVCDFDLDRMLQEHIASGATATMAVIDGPENRVHIENGTAVDVLDTLKVPYSSSGVKRTYACVMIYSKDFFDALPETPSRISMVDVWIHALKLGKKINVFSPDDGYFWSDIGSFGQYFEANEKLLVDHAMRDADLSAPFVYGENCTVAKDALLSGFVTIGANAVVPGGATLHNCVVLPNAKVRPGFHAWEIITPMQVVHRDYKLVSAMDIMKSQSEGWTLHSIPEQGSDRKFMRIQHPKNPNKILMISNERDKDFDRFAELGKFFNANDLYTPHLYEVCKKEYAVIMEDLGNDTLYSLVKDKEVKSVPLYKQVIHALAAFQVRGTAALDSCDQGIRVFSRRYLRWETDYFKDNFLTLFCGLKLDADTVALLDAELDALAFTVEKIPYLLIHRDFQSQNILIHQGVPRFVDYQGARLAPYTYDASSLIRDPYVTIPPGMREELFEEYRLALAENNYIVDPAAFKLHVILTSLQRNMQALGAYGFLALVKKKKKYLQYAEPSLGLLLLALDELAELTDAPIRTTVLARLCRAAEGLLKERLKEMGEYHV